LVKKSFDPIILLCTFFAPITHLIPYFHETKFNLTLIENFMDNYITQKMFF
jgi:hypothetical protein